MYFLAKYKGISAFTAIFKVGRSSATTRFYRQCTSTSGKMTLLAGLQTLTAKVKVY